MNYVALCGAALAVTLLVAIPAHRLIDHWMHQGEVAFRVASTGH